MPAPDSIADSSMFAAIAAQALEAIDGHAPPPPLFTTRYPDLTFDNAHRALALIHRQRLARGERLIGRKIGLTNRRLWDEYAVRTPIWGYVYDSTLHDLAAPPPLSGYREPKIEPEIVLGLGCAPSPGMSDDTLWACVAWVAHGFEIVQSIYPGWAFKAADTVAANALHGALLLGPRHMVAGDGEPWRRTLDTFGITIACNGTVIDHGSGSNVLDGPLSTLRHLIDVLARDDSNPPLSAGELVSTGTLTRALTVRPGETWTTSLTGVALSGISLTLR